MIEAKNGEVTLAGRGIDIILDYICITRSLVGTLEKEEFPESFIDVVLKSALDIAKMSDEEMEQKNREIEVLKMMKLFK